jgi:hypothetical protein
MKEMIDTAHICNVWDILVELYMKQQMNSMHIHSDRMSDTVLFYSK